MSPSSPAASRPPTSTATPESGREKSEHVQDPLQGERRLGQGPDRDLDQEQRVVVSRGAVEVDLVAERASVDEHPLARAADADRDGLHRRPAFGGPVAGVVVEVATPQTVRTVIAMSGAGSVEGDVESAMAAAERV